MQTKQLEKISADPNVSKDGQSRVRVLLADNHAVCRAGLRCMLLDTEFEIVCEAHNGRDTVAGAQFLRPDLVLLDTDFPDSNGLDVLRAIVNRHPALPVVFLTTLDNPICIAGAITNGAAGYLRKDIGRESLLLALRSAMRGETLFAPDAFNRALNEINFSKGQALGLVAPLSNRETQVLCLLGSGISNAHIAASLQIAECTVKTHIEHIVRKLGVNGRLQAAVWAARNRLDLTP